ncbi:hypothetical protein DW725_11870 [Clostridiaceae bacterium AM27-36LB]|nr:hypothetical protein DW644_15915 [Clostridiales bacterium AM23-16LB]RHR46211.1 hypothetical protein DWX14_02435 [Clostridiaceae bacterium AF18-31LB]RHT81281.1 hypothetical protein DW725_11870 [Clostridiaceae bacterium AM27-36LB]RHW00223.1 hypothetical protein DXA90_13505 [Clostridiaceae bacterium OF09-1]
MCAEHGTNLGALAEYHVNLLICSNGINTASGLYKIFIQIFAVIAEFESGTLTVCDLEQCCIG